MAITKSSMSGDHSADFNKGLGDASLHDNGDPAPLAPKYQSADAVPLATFDYPGDRT